VSSLISFFIAMLNDNLPKPIASNLQSSKIVDRHRRESTIKHRLDDLHII
jgi:hypothetical protein